MSTSHIIFLVCYLIALSVTISYNHDVHLKIILPIIKNFQLVLFA